MINVNKISNFLKKILPHKDIVKYIDGKPTLYLRRFYLTPTKWPLRLFLHHIERSDDDRHLHCHPWNFTSLLLSGGYKEEIFENPDYSLKTIKRRFKAGDVIKHRAKDAHRLDIDKPMFTLVLVERPFREWGFYTESGWKDWRTYLGVPKDTEQED